MGKRLYRSKSDKVLFGVCGGLGEYFEIDPTVIRLIFIAAAMFGGTGIIIYIVAAFIMPEDGKVNFNSYNGTGEFDIGNDKWKEPAWQKKSKYYDFEKTKMLFGGALVLIGLLFLLKQLFNLSMEYFWPVLLIVIGVALIYRGRRN